MKARACLPATAAVAVLLGCASPRAVAEAVATPVFGAGLDLSCGLSLAPNVALPGWNILGAAGGLDPDDGGWRRFRLRTGSKPDSPAIMGLACFSAAPDGAVRAEWRAVPAADANTLELFVGGGIDASIVGGGTALADGAAIPLALDGARPHLFRGAVSTLALRDRDGTELLRIAFDRPTRVLLQDGAAWGGAHLTIRLFFAEGPVTGGREYAIDAMLSCPAAGALALGDGTGTVIAAGPDWTPLSFEPWIEPGSALDFSEALPRHAPAGRHGRLVVVGDHFEFEGLPGVPQRFYGANLCGDANLPSSREAADRFAANLARIGYNSVRVHHHERYMIVEDGQLHPGRDDTEPSPGQWEKFDNLVAACVEHGLYLTTDLFVSRSYVTPWRAIGIDRDGAVPAGAFKVLCAFHEPAYSNLCAWTRAFLGHVNPRSGRSLAEEPALATLALINEGNLGAFGVDTLRETPGVLDAWRAWIAQRKAKEATGGSGGGEPPVRWSDIPDTLPAALLFDGGSSPEARHAAAFAIFLAERETILFERLKRFVREECGCPAPLSNLSASWFNPVQYQLPRTHLDYVDDHFYVDHPVFLETPWRLPMSCANANPVKGSAAGARDVEWRRLMDRPFCLTEWNYAAPGRFRGAGGLATGALGALQDWDGIWRFAWSHGRRGIENPGRRLGNFDVNDDPLSFASERAALCLFLRRDLEPLAEARPAVLRAEDLLDPRRGATRYPGPAQPLALGWSARVGTTVRSSDEIRGTRDEIRGNELGASRHPSLVTVDGERGALAIDTPRTCGGFAESGRIDAGPLSFEIVESQSSDVDRPPDANPPSLSPPPSSLVTCHSSLVTCHSSLHGGHAVPATLWASSLDGEPLERSSRILVAHLTDVQMEGARFGDPDRTILLDWGKSACYLVRNGAADVSLRLVGASGAELPSVWALDTAGNRVGEVPSAYDPAAGILRFRVCTRGPDGRGRLFYEIVRTGGATGTNPGDPLLARQRGK